MSFMQEHAWLSTARFAPFLNEVDGNHEGALELYDWHAETTAACFESIHHFEVMVRNAIDETLGVAQPQEPLRDTWLMDFSTLHPGGVKQVIVAVERLQKGASITRGRVVAGLSFGFWAGLFSKSYEELWRQRLHHAFSQRSLVRKDLSHRMRAIQRFRNRVAHHDSLLGQDIERHMDDMLDIVGWIDPEARGWLATRSRVHALLARRPGPAHACPPTAITSGAGSR
ncbi:MAG TPA: hypothetical protein VFY48_07085 [Solirubrobacterales bacterium]|nr:hypothetical protein [Solirubrobacterales bacterium]